MDPVAQRRALLLTDVVDSTALSQRLGDAATAALWAQHDRAARDLLPRWRGREIDKSDGLLLLFDEAADALHYALDYHRALAELPVPLQARAGLHVGAVLLRENPPEDVARGAKPLEVDGLAKPLAARVMALAQGGQTLITEDALAALAGLPAVLGFEAAAHGHWQLKGVDEPVRVHELWRPGTAPRPPEDGEKGFRVVQHQGRWQAVREIPNNLPEPPNAFVGRERELAEIQAHLARCRLLTLLGMGGLGKTRLSLQAAALQRERFPDGVWFIDLAGLRDESLVAAEAAQVLGLREEPGRGLVQTLGEHLKPRRTLLILDNCEHLLAPVAALAHALLRTAPQVVMLASSREALGVPGEQLLPILPLPVPRASDGMAALGASTAVRLFLDRAREQRPDFELNADSAGAVAGIVARLEGIPLALELAAARLRSLSVQDIDRRLQNRFKLLTGGARVRDERQQTLRGLIDWSYELLDEGDRAVLQRLSAFSGGFDLAAAEAVCADEELQADDVLDHLDSLTQKSLLMLDAEQGETRWRMLETLRDYAAEKLSASGQAEAVAGRHMAHFFDFAKQGRNGMQGPQQGAWVLRLERDEDNLRSAIRHARQADPVVAVKLAVALQNFWILRGRCAEGRDAVDALLALPAVTANDMAHAHALYVGAALSWTLGDAARALASLDRCLALRRNGASPMDVAATLSTRAVSLLAGGQAEAACRDATEALALMQTSGYRVGEAIVQVQIAQILAWQGEAEAARLQGQAGLAAARALRHPETEAEAELVLAGLDLEAGNLAAAQQAAQRCLALCGTAGDRRGSAQALAVLARVAFAAGQVSASAACWAEALRSFDDFGMREPWLAGLDAHVPFLVVLEDAHGAAALAAAAERLRGEAGLQRAPAAQARVEAERAALRQRLGDTVFEAAWLEGLALGAAQAQQCAAEAAEKLAASHPPVRRGEGASALQPLAKVD